jgi:hypothetical protein
MPVARKLWQPSRVRIHAAWLGPLRSLRAWPSVVCDDSDNARITHSQASRLSGGLGSHYPHITMQRALLGAIAVCAARKMTWVEVGGHVRFATDPPLEGTGFEPLVPLSAGADEAAWLPFRLLRSAPTPRLEKDRNHTTRDRASCSANQWRLISGGCSAHQRRSEFSWPVRDCSVQLVDGLAFVKK